MKMQPAEYGMPIMRQTGCAVGAHAFAWTGYQTNDTAPPAATRCSCGLVTWDEWVLVADRDANGTAGCR